MTGCLLTVVVYIRMKRIGHGWVLLLTFLASAKAWVPSCICSMKEGCLKWDRGWQSGQLENPLQDAQIYRNMRRYIEICLEIMDGEESHAHPLDLRWKLDASLAWYLLTVWSASTAQGTEWR